MNFQRILILAEIYTICISRKNPAINNFSINSTQIINGYLNISKEDSLFFWIFKSRDKNERAPLVWWVAGGMSAPETAIFGANGPFIYNKDKKILEGNEYAWNNMADVIYIDMPLSNGFSLNNHPTHIPSNNIEFTESIYQFFANFYDQFPEYLEREIYVLGYSYAGIQILDLMTYFRSQDNSIFMKNLRGIGLGNAVIDALNQAPYASKLVYSVDKLSYFKYIISQIGSAIAGVLGNLGLFEGAYLVWRMQNSIYQGGIIPKFDPGNYQENCCNSYEYMKTYISSEQFRNLFHIEQNIPYVDTNIPALFPLWVTTIYLSKISEIRKLLNQGVKIYMFNGVLDTFCPALATQDLLFGEVNNFEKFKPWFVGGTLMGEFIQDNLLTFIKVFGAGHGVIYDNRPFAYDMLYNLIYQTN